MKNPPTILSTRPLFEAQNDARTLEALGYKILLAPMLNIKPHDFTPPDLKLYQGLIFTSPQAVRLFAAHAHTQDIPVFCVGETTKSAAQEAGFKNIHTAQGTAKSLLPLIQTQTQDNTPFLHICGEDKACDMESAFSAQGLTLESLPIYKAQYTDILPSETLTALQNHEIQAITFFSKRTAQNFMRLIKMNSLSEDLKFTTTLCISINVLEDVQPCLWREALVARKPERQCMFDLLENEKQGT